MFFTESFITESHSVSEYLIDGFQPPVVCMKNRGGACGFIRNDIIFSEVCVPNPTEDLVWFSIKTEDNVNRLYGCVYRSPNSSSENNSKLCENVSWASEKFSEIILLGDYNFPSIKWLASECNDQEGQIFLDTLESHGFQQLVAESTRYRHGQTPSLLDLIISNTPNVIENVKIGDPFGKSDHCRIEFDVRNAYSEERPKPYKYNLKKIDKVKFMESVNRNDWELLLAQNDLDKVYDDFVDNINAAINESTPRYDQVSKTLAPWSNELLGKLSRRKRKK